MPRMLLGHPGAGHNYSLWEEEKHLLFLLINRQKGLTMSSVIGPGSGFLRWEIQKPVWHPPNSAEGTTWSVFTGHKTQEPKAIDLVQEPIDLVQCWSIQMLSVSCILCLGYLQRSFAISLTAFATLFVFCFMLPKVHCPVRLPLHSPISLIWNLPCF